MKKKLFSLLLCLALILSVGVVAYAAAGGFTMTYRPGTSDTVTNMPDADSGVGGQAYTVSDKIPQREGYEFLGWTLDYGVSAPVTYTLTYHVTGDPNYGIPGDTATPDPVTGIPAGGSVTLAAPLSYTDTGTKEYTVNYIDKDNNAIKESMVGYAAVGDQVKQNAADISGWKPLDTELPLTIAGDTWVFTGWCSDEACTNPITDVTNISADTDVYGKWVCTPAVNEITFCYEEMPEVQNVTYTVKYVEEITERVLHKPETKTVPYGTTVKEYPVPIEGYFAIDNEISGTIYGGEVMVFVYYSENENI